MALIVTQSSGAFTPMPEGFHEAVYSEIRDLGEQPDKFNPGKMKRQIAATITNAAGQEATRWYTPSLHEKSTLSKDLVALKGSIPAKLDLEKLVGVQCKVLITAGTNSKGQPTAKVEKVMKPSPDQKVPVKKINRKAADAPAAPAKAAQSQLEKELHITDEDLGF